jgi:hypothetical protein
MTDTFSTYNLKVVEVVKENRIGGYYYDAAVQCRTSAFADYLTLSSMAGNVTATQLLSGYYNVQTDGTEATLVLGGSSHSNCAIKEISAAEVSNSMEDVWDFTITFVEDTST